MKNNDDNNSTTGSKKLKRGNMIMEGSRCSCVDGRGWWCCQQTPIGYSLYEHHLEKGRLKSMASVQNCAITTPKKYEIESSIEREEIIEKVVMYANVEENAEEEERSVTRSSCHPLPRSSSSLSTTRSDQSLL
ncbi:hypothetical protein U1Q18_035532, partial [Sarracenia purpurea var. burkii]